jgi:hypothetical protein
VFSRYFCRYPLHVEKRGPRLGKSIRITNTRGSIAFNCTQILERVARRASFGLQRLEEKQLTAAGSGKALTIESQDLALLLGSPLLLVGYKSLALAGNRNRYSMSIAIDGKQPLVVGVRGDWSSCAKVGSGHLRSYVQRMTEEEKGRWARVKARAGERLARAEAVRWRNIVLEVMGWLTRGVWGRRGSLEV